MSSKAINDLIHDQNCPPSGFSAVKAEKSYMNDHKIDIRKNESYKNEVDRSHEKSDIL